MKIYEFMMRLVRLHACYEVYTCLNVDVVKCKLQFNSLRLIRLHFLIWFLIFNVVSIP